MKTKAAILFKINKPLLVEEIEVPKLLPGQVLVKMTASGICRGQLNEMTGLKGKDKYLPHLLGHEGAGEVLETGRGVTKVKSGDHVVATWIAGRGEKAGSAKFKWGKRVVNAGPIATFSEYTVISENRLVSVPRLLPPTVASLLGCAVPTGAGAVIHHLRSKKSTVAVFGVGGVGASAILVAASLGVKKIIAIDIKEEKLRYAKKLGATDSLNFQKADIFHRMKKITSNGIDFAFEATGVKEVMEKAFELLNNQGTLIIAGNLKAGERIAINPFGLISGKKILGTWGGETDPDRDIPFYAKLYLSGKLKLDLLITKTFSLEEINQAFTLLRFNKSLGRIVIDFTKK